MQNEVIESGSSTHIHLPQAFMLPSSILLQPCQLYHQPLKMEPIQGSETSANYNLTPGKYPEEHFQHVSSVKLLHSAVIVNVTLTILVLISHIHFQLNGYLLAYLTTLNTQVLL